MANKPSPQLYAISELAGMIQRLDQDSIPANTSPLLKNIDLSKPGTWRKRSGTDLFATTLAGGALQGLIEFDKSDGSREIHAIRDSNLDVYDATTDEWVTKDAGQFGVSAEVQSVNYNNRVYHVSTGDDLCYETGGSCTVRAGNEIRGNSIATAQRTLFVGGITSVGGVGKDFRDRVYYSLFNGLEGANEPDDRLYDYASVPAETIGSSTRWFTVFSPVTALYTYGTTGLVYIFTENDCWQFDMRLENNATGLQKVFDVGCANPRAVTECNNWLIWMAPDARIWAWGGEGQPVPLSFDLEDDTSGEALVELIDQSERDKWALGSKGNVFYASVGDITYYDTELENVELAGYIDSQMNYTMWSLNVYPYRPNIYAQTEIDATKSLIFGVEDAFDVYQTNSGLADNGTAIDAFARTKFMDFGAPYNTKQISEVQVKMKPQGVDGVELEVKYATDGKISYSTFSNINSYASDSATNLDDVRLATAPAGIKCRTLSLQFGDSNLNGTFEVSAIGIMRSLQPYNKRIVS